MKNVPLNDIGPIEDLRALVDGSAKAYGEHDAFLERTRDGAVMRISYARFASDVAALGTALLDTYPRGSRIALLGENSYAWVLAYFAIVNSGLVVVPIDKGLDAESMLDQLERAQVACLCHTALYASEAQAASTAFASQNGGKNLPLADLGSLSGGNLAPSLLGHGRALVEAGCTSFRDVVLDRDATCSIVFTSGTTGRSKGVMLSHRSLGADTQSACQLVTLCPDDLLVSVLPLHHTFEDMCGLLGPFRFGSTVAFCPGAKQLRAYLDAFSPTVICLVPLYIETFHDAILRAARKEGREAQLLRTMRFVRALQHVHIDLAPALLKRARAALGGRLRIILAGGAYLNPSYFDFYEALGVEIIQGYGVTECSPLISSNRNEMNRFGSVGLVSPCCKLKIDRQGQIVVSGDLVMNGYLDDSESTSEAMHDGWFDTGDLGHLDSDGFLYLDGRCKDIIVLSNGENIMPAEIERALCESPYIAEAVVIAGPPGANGPSCLVAHIRPDLDRIVLEGAAPPGTQACDPAVCKLVAGEVRRIDRELAYHKRVTGFSLHAEPFEKTTTCKVKRFLLENNWEGIVDV